MKIAFLTSSLTLGGAERQLINLANELVDIGHVVTIIVIRDSVPHVVKNNISSAVRLEYLKRERWYELRFLLRLIKFVRRERPDIVHSYLASANLVAVLIHRFHRGKTVWGIRSARSKMEGKGLIARLMGRTLDYMVTIPDLTISNSAAGRDVWVSRGIPADKIVVVPNGIDTVSFCVSRGEGDAFRGSLGAGEEVKLIGIVASLRPVKDHETFFRMATELIRRDPNYRFVVVGEGDASYRNNLLKIAADLGVQNHVIWLGLRDDLRAIYNGLDVVVSTSLAEGFSNVIAESMACGTPVVATDVGDSKIIVGRSELVSDPGDWLALANAVDGALKERAAGALSSESLRGAIVSRFSLGGLAPRTLTELSRIAPDAYRESE